MTTPQHARSAIGFGLALVALVVPVMLSAIVPNVGGPFVSFSPVTINATAGDQFDPHISGDWVSYTSDLEIRYYRFSTGTDAAIPMGASARDLLAGISGSKIVFSRVIVGVKTAVMVFDASTPLVAPIEIDPTQGATRIGAAIGGNTVAYLDFGLEPKGELVISDLTTLASWRITDDTSFDANASVSPDGNVVTWEHCTASLFDCDVWQSVKSGASWTTTVVSNTANAEANPNTNGVTVAYDSVRNSNTDIFWRPVAGGSEAQLERSSLDVNPSMAGDFISFESRATLFDNADIFVYDVVNNLLYQITDTPLVNEHLNDITLLPSGDLRAVWTSDEDSVYERNIRAVTFRLPDVGTNFTFGGFLQPVDPYPTINLMKSGAAVPVKFSLGGYRGLDIFMAGYPKSQVMTCGPDSLLAGIEETVTAGGSSLSYDASNDQYKYVWKTEKSWAGTCRQLVIQFADHSIQRANFKFK